MQELGVEVVDGVVCLCWLERLRGQAEDNRSVAHPHLLGEGEAVGAGYGGGRVDPPTVTQHLRQKHV